MKRKRIYKIINFRDGVHEPHVVQPWKAANRIDQVLPYVPQGAGESLLKLHVAMGKSLPEAVEAVLDEVAEACVETHAFMKRLPTPVELERHLAHAIAYVVAIDFNTAPTGSPDD